MKLVKTVLGSRTLFSEDLLGLHKYNRRKDEVGTTPAKKDYLLEKLFSQHEKSIQSAGIVELKKLCYLVENEDDFALFEKILAKYLDCRANKSITFHTFTLGPEIMRMYYKLNKPLQAFQLIQTQTRSFSLNDTTTYLIAQALLYKNELYEEVCEVFRILKKKQIRGVPYHHLQFILFQAACYKMGSQDSLKEALDNLDDYVKYKQNIPISVGMYTYVFALSQGVPDILLKYIKGNDDFSINMKIAAFLAMGNDVEAISHFGQLQKKSFLIKSVADEISKRLCFLKDVEGDRAISETYKIYLDQLKRPDYYDISCRTWDEFLELQTIKIEKKYISYPLKKKEIFNNATVCKMGKVVC